jgi:phenylacetate-coenzyme A ligase PaaK-like adenylate-forming protein
MLESPRRLATFVSSLRRYLRAGADPEPPAVRIRRDLETRSDRFLAFVQAAIHDRPGSPYAAMLRHAGIEPGDVSALVDERGVDGALARLRDAGVHVTPDELKGRVPIVRGSLVIEPGAADFRNPQLGESIVVLSGGTSGPPTPTVMIFDDLLEDAAYLRLWVEGAGLEGRPLVLWRGVPPSHAGLRGAMRSLRTGLQLAQWLSPTPVAVRHRAPRDAVALRVAWTVALAHGTRLPWPRHVPLDDADVVAHHLERHAAAGRPAVLDATAGAAVRACRAAERLGLDVTGTVVRTGGEPLTASKAAAIAGVGAHASCHYQANEVGRIGFACTEPDAVDDVHIAEGRIAVIPGDVIDGGDPRVLISSISPMTKRVLLNVDLGDTAVLVRRNCGCPAGRAGLRLHANTIRAAAKITTDGTNILHTDLLELVEKVLPGRFGGGPTDYQLVEGEHRGVPRLSIVVSPRVGAVDEAEVVRTVLAHVGRGETWRGMTAGVWRDGGTLVVARREPHTTHVGKLQAFHRET